MNMATSIPGSGPRALIRSGLVTTDLLAVPLLAVGFALVLGFGAAALGSVASGIYVFSGSGILYAFPEFPLLARILTGLSLLAFSTVLGVATVLLWQLFRAAWLGFWGWHTAAWQGASGVGAVAGTGARLGKSWAAFLGRLRLYGLVFLGLFAVALAVMFLLAHGPFWHVWGWFV